MSLELLTTVAVVGTFVVITATAIAAVIQVRHMRTANQGTWVQAWMADFDGSEYRDAFHFVRSELAERLEDPAFREELRSGKVDRLKHPEIIVCNVFEKWGTQYRLGVVDRRVYIREVCSIIDDSWKILEPVVALIASRTGGENIRYQSYEYLAVMARAWIANHPRGTYPKDASRKTIVDPWREIDSRTTAATE